MLRKTAFYLALLCLAASAWADTAAGVAAFRNRQFDLAWRELSGPAEAGDPVAAKLRNFPPAVAKSGPSLEVSLRPVLNG